MRIALLILPAICLLSCKHTQPNADIGNSDIYVTEIDKCEYIVLNGYNQGCIIHKQNCKHCEARKK